MPIPIETRAQKNLSTCDNYTDLRLGASDWSDRVELSDGDRILGVYENSPGILDKSILVTEFGMYLFDAEGPLFIPYREMKRVQLPADRIREIKLDKHLHVSLNDGRHIVLPIYGEQGISVDVFAFYQFLGGVMQTLEIEERKSGILIDCDPNS